MQRLQAYKYAFMPTGEQQRQMRRFAGSCRFVFNKALALQKAHYEAGGKFISYMAMAKHLTEWRNSTETPWLKGAPVHPLQHALKDLDRAHQIFSPGERASHASGARGTVRAFAIRMPKCPARLPAQDHDHDQPKPRDPASAKQEPTVATMCEVPYA
jgi:putative transposase